MRRIFVLIFFLFYFRNSHSVYIAFASLDNGHRAAATATETTTTVHWQQCMNNNIIYPICVHCTQTTVEGLVYLMTFAIYVRTYIIVYIYIYIQIYGMLRQTVDLRSTRTTHLHFVYMRTVHLS